MISLRNHYSDVIMSRMASQITSISIVYSAVCSGEDRSNIKYPCRVTALCEGNSPETGKFPAHRASNAENYSIWWRHHANLQCFLRMTYFSVVQSFSITAHITKVYNNWNGCYQSKVMSRDFDFCNKVTSGKTCWFKLTKSFLHRFVV